MMDSITLSALLADYSHIRLASEEDNQDILDFCEKVAMKTNEMTLRYERSPDYFAFLREQGYKYFCFVFENEDRSVGGIASISLRRQFVAGKPVMVAYLCDLRTSQTLYRRARVQWRQLYSRIIAMVKKIIEFENCQFLYSAVLGSNEIAQSALIKRRRHYVYHEIFQYQTLTLLFSWPLAHLYRRWQLQRKSYQYRRATPEDEPALRAFLHRESRRKTLGEHIEPQIGAEDELSRRWRDWHHFSIRSFILACDESGNIKACVAPWQQYHARRLLVSGVSFGKRILGGLLELLGGKQFRDGDRLQILNLTHLEFDSDCSGSQRSSLFLGLMEFVHNLPERKSCHFISVMDHAVANLKPVLEKAGFFLQVTPGRLYQVLSPEDYAKGSLIPIEKNRAVAFELGVA